VSAFSSRRARRNSPKLFASVGFIDVYNFCKSAEKTLTPLESNVNDSVT